MRTTNALLLGAAVAGTRLQQASAFIGAPMLPRTSVAATRSASRVAARPHMVAVGTNVEKVAGSDKEGLLDTSRMERLVLLCAHAATQFSYALPILAISCRQLLDICSDSLPCLAHSDIALTKALSLLY
jgi:hypothetical protein